ncbi:TPA: LysR family transcriptional regulator [Enterococcus faecalis]|nr:LysR family transcriptional regulator [Enterococcus faecalis]
MFKLLKTFQIVYEQMNFSKAATCLYISQPAVSNQIKQLEEELGCSLFLRNGRQDVVPTRQAEVLYNRLLNLADDWQETLTALHQARLPKETCRIAASNTFAVYYLPQLMQHLQTQYATINFVLEMNNSEEVVEKVEKHQVDFGFIEKPLITKGASREEIIQDQLVLAGDPANQNWLVREKDSGVFHYTQQYLEESNQSPTLMTVKNNEMIVKMLELGMGQSLLSRKAITEKIPFQTLGEKYWRSFYFLTRGYLKSSLLQEVKQAIYRFYQTEMNKY